MSVVIIKPYSGCNLHCRYCFEEKLRKKHPQLSKMNYDLKAILKRMDEFRDLPMALQGGEILCMPKEDLEKILAKMYELKGESFLHTNAVLIDKQWIKIFKKYKTKISIAWDGPGELSAYRPGTNKVGEIIELLAKEKMISFTHIVISKSNAGNTKRLEGLKKYLLKLDKLDISGRLLPCTNAPDYELSMQRLKKVYLDLAEFCLENNLNWTPFTDIVKRLKGEGAVCVFMPCDPFHNQSVITILEDGSLAGCMRSNQFKDVLLRGLNKHKTREEILKNISQENKGCKECKYWSACYGGCSFDVINDDWRNRTYLCPVWKALFEFFERILIAAGEKAVLKKQEAIENKCAECKHIAHKDTSHGDSPHQDNPSFHEDFSPKPPIRFKKPKGAKKRKGIAKEDFKVDFIGIAAPRSGTTWIAKCLYEHPQICFSSKKELDFFLDANYKKGLSYYQKFFDHCEKGKIKGEYSASYYLNEKAPSRIKKHFPDAKLIACLRNPVGRALSYYKFKIKTGQKVNSDISKELELNRYYKICGFYYQHLRRFLKYFNKQDILILIYEDALKNPDKFIQNIYKFLGVDEKFVPRSLHEKINITSKKIKMDEKIREKLRKEFKEDIKKLEKLINRDLSFWK